MPPSRSTRPRAHVPSPSITAGSRAPSCTLEVVRHLAPAADPAAAAGIEWLQTNALGGFAMGTAAGVPTRRYHGLLIAAMTPPVGRVMVVNATVDRLIVGGPGTTTGALNANAPSDIVDLSGFRFAGLGPDRIHPDGVTRCTRFEHGVTTSWTFELPAARLRKSVHLLRATNAVAIELAIERGTSPKPRPGALRLACRPLLSLRSFHELIRRSWADDFRIHDSGTHAVTVSRHALSARLTSDHATWRTDPQWWGDLLYTQDAARAQDCVEDLFSAGEFHLDLQPDQNAATAIIRIGLDGPHAPNPDELANSHRERTERLAITLPRRPDSERAISSLVAAADQFVVKRTGSLAEGASIIAGYPWFGDWGRDTLISLPGLLLCTGRLSQARAVLETFAAHQKHGLIPNLFNEHTGHAEHNTVDASLWFIHAACAYLDAAGDREFWNTVLAPACLDIVAHYRRGTEFNIAMDPFDKLITAGTAATQLTWMDARRDGVVFTPRHGKPVEINALWISALKRLALALNASDSRAAANLTDLSNAAARSFRQKFWNPAGAGGSGCLFDVLTPGDSSAGPVTWTPDASVRPNQIFAVSLPHSPLAPEQQLAVVACVKSRLLTPRGVRTLDPEDSRYRGRYEGNLFQRDQAYHNGTAWPWLLGPLAEAIMRSAQFNASSRDDARTVLAPILSTLSTDGPDAEPGSCLGQIAEIYDGDAPQRPQGCVAQAWSVAEALRVLILADEPTSNP